MGSRFFVEARDRAQGECAANVCHVSVGTSGTAPHNVLMRREDDLLGRRRTCEIQRAESASVSQQQQQQGTAAGGASDSNDSLRAAFHVELPARSRLNSVAPSQQWSSVAQRSASLGSEDSDCFYVPCCHEEEDINASMDNLCKDDNSGEPQRGQSNHARSSRTSDPQQQQLQQRSSLSSSATSSKRTRVVSFDSSVELQSTPDQCTPSNALTGSTSGATLSLRRSLSATQPAASSRRTVNPLVSRLSAAAVAVHRTRDQELETHPCALVEDAFEQENDNDDENPSMEQSCYIAAMFLPSPLL